MWHDEDILELLTGALRDEDHRLREEQAVHGLDRLSEVALQAVLTRAITAHGLGAFREQVYPCAPIAGSRLTERQRCDLVLTRSPLCPPIDPDDARRAAAASAGTLFAHTAVPELSPGCAAEYAYWLELKLVGQFTFNRGVPVPNTTYTAELTAGLAADLAKLAADPMIRHGAAALVLFNADQEIADHDVRALSDRAARRGQARLFMRRSFGVLDRIGNRVCTVVVAPAK